MALSIFTNASSMAATSALNKSNTLLGTAMKRLGTGKRINSAADDAAGLQIATRLQGQSNGMAVAKRNISDATAMLQTAEGAFDEVTNILYRMKDLATQSANDTNTQKDRTAMQGEFEQLSVELNNIMANTSFGGDKLLASGASASGGKLFSTSGVTFQIGASKSEIMNFNLSTELKGVHAEFKKFSALDVSGNVIAGGTKISAQVDSNNAIKTLSDTLDKVSDVRSKLGANINRLAHTKANLSNVQDNTDLALGNIRDADFAMEASSMTRNQMLAQTGMTMLKQSNQMTGMVMGLLG